MSRLQSKRDRGVRLYVDQDFRNHLKAECALNGESMVDYTRRMARQMKSINQEHDSVEGKGVEKRLKLRF